MKMNKKCKDCIKEIWQKITVCLPEGYSIDLLDESIFSDSIYIRLRDKEGHRTENSVNIKDNELMKSDIHKMINDLNPPCKLCPNAPGRFCYRDSLYVATSFLCKACFMKKLDIRNENE